MEGEWEPRWRRVTSPKRRYVLDVNWLVEGRAGIVHAIPKGFVTDGASIPRIFWFIVGGKYAPEVIGAATVHDYYYRTGIAERRTADDRFYNMLRDDGVSWWRAGLMYRAVHWFGGLFYEGGIFHRPAD